MNFFPREFIFEGSPIMQLYPRFVFFYEGFIFDSSNVDVLLQIKTGELDSWQRAHGYTGP